MMLNMALALDNKVLQECNQKLTIIVYGLSKKAITSQQKHTVLLYFYYYYYQFFQKIR